MSNIKAKCCKKYSVCTKRFLRAENKNRIIMKNIDQKEVKLHILPKMS